MSSASNLAKFDSAVGSTVNVGIEDAYVPDVTHFMKESAYVAIMTPQGDPFDKDCIWGAPVVYWGLPAVAKSDRVEQASFEACLKYSTIYPGQRQPEDFSGVLVPYPTGVVIESMLGAVRQLNPLGRGVIFLDEINNATRATANRFCHFQVKCPPVDKFLKYLINETREQIFDAGGTEDMIRSKWGAVYGHNKALLAGYLQAKPTALHHEPEPEHPQSGFGWGSPRSWVQGIRMWSTAEILGYSSEIRDACLEGCVGEGLAFEFQTWLRSADLPRPEEVLQGKWKPDGRRLDVSYAVLISVTQYTVSCADQQEAVNRAVGAWNLFQKFIEVGSGDMIISSAQTLVKKGLTRKAGGALEVAAGPAIKWMADNGMLRYIDQR